MKKIDLLAVTLEELQAMTEEEYPRKDDAVFDSVVIVPTEDIHDSDFRCMKFILIKDSAVVGVCGGNSDVIHINGIGGYGQWYSHVPALTKPVGWSLDCLPCGVLRLFGHRNMTTDVLITSDFSVYATDPKRQFVRDMQR